MDPDSPPLILPEALLLDMDGTLTAPMLDFPRIKAEMGIGSRPILEALAEMEGPARQIAEAVLLRHEQDAALGSTLNPGCRELLDWAGRRGVRTALITRNSLLSVQTVLRLHRLPLTVLITRDDAPPKPSPEPLRLACRRLELRESGAWMVGDGQYDVEAGLVAGVRTVWVGHGRPRPFAARPWRAVKDLPELLGLLRRCNK